MEVYRISSKRYADDLSGIGAGLYGGRWNPKGLNMVYTAGSISLACMEYLVHNIHLMASKEICLSKIQISETAPVLHINEKQLPADWNEKSYLPITTQNIGQENFEKGINYVLKVPSVIVPDESNYLLNPYHEYHDKTSIVEQIFPFTMDERLFGLK